MADQNEISVKINASVDGFVNAIRSATTSAETGFSSIESMISKVSKAFIGLSAVVAGGAMFEKVVNKTVDYVKESEKLARTLNITAEEASVLNIALGDIYVTSDLYTSAANKLSMQLATGGKNFEKFGIQTKDSNGNFLSMNTIMTNTLDKLRSLNGTTAQNVEGAALFGRQWGEARKLLKLTSEAIDEAKSKSKELNLVVDSEAQEAVKNYRAAMNDFEDTVAGLTLTLGKAILPILTQITELLNGEGGDAVRSFASIISATHQIFISLAGGVAKVIEQIVFFAQDLYALVEAIGKTNKAIVTMDFGSAKTAWKDYFKDIENNKIAHEDKMFLIEESTEAKIQEAMGLKKKPTEEKKKPGGPDVVSGLGQEDDARMKQWELNLKKRIELKTMEAAQNGQYYERDLKEEQRYWQQKLSLSNLSDKERMSIEDKITSLKIDNYKKDLDAKKASINTAMAEEVNNLNKKREYALQEQAMYSQGTKGYEESRRKVLEIEREIRNQQKNLLMSEVELVRDTQLSIAEIEQENIATRKEIGLITDKQEIEELIKIENKRFQIKLESAKKMAELEPDDQKRKEMLDRIGKIEQEHSLKMIKLNNTALKQTSKLYKDWFDGLTSGFSGAIKGLITYTTSWGDAFKMVMSSALDFAINTFTEMGLTAIKNFLLQETVGKTTAAGQIQANAGVAATGAMGSVATIPGYGWIAAPLVAAGIFAAAMAYKSLASAAGGWETVPHDQLAMIHKDEQVLPAKYAQGLRNLINKSESSGGFSQQPSNTYHFNINAIDSKSFEQALRGKQKGLIKVMTEATRNGRMRT